ncbi:MULTISPECIES: LysR family transcriptional regulator [unclassified Novosphingobium]|uniref:LysR family transcriptional regulator n=1 Tax=unclassified Novosphingobium TaxID=2644732 RepID=UPI001494A3E0|nr:MULTISPECIES: LysR family transcriptional regulator [unclassified Novosphingobium]MBB3357832.1 DNA-binding transcriptional LysR family regulator [Novosphingobium sp. BK256]MBB3373504.1 DNA-binding transcriptional LysR family regulator [Novosphingobium sp. BK280]MBB3377916.1 DNA-binding transcriptional LysR family regulator [Novosphingobium sp. BK258]MBB3420299.1 DNA-binding transcriptional LysR family regulator [Novosphingobium sp. BK267]MBB3447379.1 DNA-binding transcriptional LysR family 
MKRLAIYHLETLLWIARLGTFRAAAERLNTTQPAISARVKEIEEQLGVDLFRREGRNMVLTARGRALVADFEPLWAGFERALFKASDFGGATGIVRIGTGEIAAASCLPAFVAAVEQNLPGVTLEIELDLTARMLQQLLAGTSDMVFLAGPVASPGVRTTPLGSVALVWAASKATAQAGGFKQALPVWSIPEHSPIHGIMRESLAQHGITPPVIRTCNNVRALVEIIRLGSGAALLPETMVRGELASGELVQVLPSPKRQLRFEAAIRSAERDPLILELFRRVGGLRID